MVETIFGWPGMGRIIVTAIFQRDYPLVMANAFISAVLVVGANLLADVAYSFIDPRIRQGGEGKGRRPSRPDTRSWPGCFCSDGSGGRGSVRS